MHKTIKLKTQDVAYTLKTSRRARCMRLAIYQTGELVATLPFGMSIRRLERFIQEKSDWILKRIGSDKNYSPRSSRLDYLKNKERARTLVQERISEINQIYNFSYSRISIRNQATRWGSCSVQGNLNFNYRIVYLPPHLADYIIVHELCHLQEMNHSQNFWRLVARAIPEYTTARRTVRQLRV